MGAAVFLTLAKSVNVCYTYDSLSRVTKRVIKDFSDVVLNEENYTYDAAGNITDAPESCFVYDTNNRLTVFNGSSVTYDLDGNMLSNGCTVFEYDSANRLVKACDHTYTYNAEDVRIRNLCGEADTTYTYDTNSKLSQLLEKTTNGIVTKYVYGLGLIGEECEGAFKTYHFDSRGSTVAITDINGVVTDTFNYDTYGNLVSCSGSSEVIFGYNGRDGVVTDKNGLIYMRARYYSPEMRRFVNADILHGAISDSTSLNRYSYVNGNPVSFVDPFGLVKDDKSTVDLSSVLSAKDLRKIQEIWGYIDLGIKAADMHFELFYEYVRHGVQNAVRPNNIGKGIWEKQINAELQWIDDILGPTSKLSKTFDFVSLKWLKHADAISVGVDTAIGVYENIENGESAKEIGSDIVIDVGVGAATAVVASWASAAVIGAVAGTTIGSTVPVLGNICGAAVGFLIGVGGYFLNEWLDDKL